MPTTAPAACDQPDHDDECNVLIGVKGEKAPKPPVQKSPMIGTMFLNGLCGSDLPWVSAVGRRSVLADRDEISVALVRSARTGMLCF
jgi:hypothetical protein